MPLLGRGTLSSLVEAIGRRRRSDAAHGHLDRPNGYSRIVRDKDERVARIVDEPDATELERQIGEVATNVYCFRHGSLLRRFADCRRTTHSASTT